jgi:hypothetical protein
MIVVCLLGAGAAVVLVAQENRSAQEARIGIERLHQQDVEATLLDKADELAKLWDNEAVRIQPGSSPEVGKARLPSPTTWNSTGLGRSKAFRSSGSMNAAILAWFRNELPKLDCASRLVRSVGMCSN